MANIKDKIKIIDTQLAYETFQERWMITRTPDGSNVLTITFYKKDTKLNWQNDMNEYIGYTPTYFLVSFSALLVLQ